jgi:hypothetical protein
MTDLPNSAADRAANAPAPGGETPAGDPELAALVRRDPPPGDGDPSLAALVNPGRRPASSTFPATPAPAAPDDATIADAPVAGEPTGTAPADTLPTFEPGIGAVPAPPLAAAVTDGEPPARPRHRRSLALRFGVSFVLGVMLAVGIGAGALYAWGQQYDGRVLPGVRVGTTEVGGLTREQAEAAIANAYGWLGSGQITLTGPDGQMPAISYADLGRGPDTSALLDAALVAGR